MNTDSESAGGLHIENLSFAYEPDSPPCLDNLSASIRPGVITGLVGSDGAGKTTLMRLIAALLRPSSGSIRVFGHDTRTAAQAIHGLISYMPQQFGLYEDLSVMQNLRLYADLHNVAGSERRQVFDRVLSFTGLHPFTERLAGRLSGGMKQKLGLACTLLHKPRLLLLDEPSVGVDPVSRRELLQMVREQVDRKTTVIWATAYLDETEHCQEVLLLDRGRLLFAGAPGTLTGRIAGRSYRIRRLTGNRRQVLSRALQHADVTDGILQGRSVRLIMKPDSEPPPPSDLEAGSDAFWQEAEPRFEDAYVDILGGSGKGESPLARHLAIRADHREAPVIASGLTKRFGDFTAVRDVSFRIRRGEVFGLLGPNGAGKSTTFKMLCGLLKATQGSGRIAGYDLSRAPGKARSRLGYMAQKFSLYGDLSARQNLDFFSGVYGLKGRRKKQTIERMTEIFALQPYLGRSAKDLPLGFKQRLALACAVIHEPAVLFLDEPTSGVDPLTRREFWTHINGLVERGVTILVTTHFMDEAEYCDRIGLIYRGQMIDSGSPDDLKERVATGQRPEPTLEEAFIDLLQRWDRNREEQS